MVVVVVVRFILSVFGWVGLRLLLSELLLAELLLDGLLLSGVRDGVSGPSSGIIAWSSHCWSKMLNRRRIIWGPRLRRNVLPMAGDRLRLLLLLWLRLWLVVGDLLVAGGLFVKLRLLIVGCW